MRATKKDIAHRTPEKVNNRKHFFSVRGTFKKIRPEFKLDLPDATSLGIHLGSTRRSLSGVKIPSILPNMEERPKVKSMTKNNMAHTCGAGISLTASVNAINARPVPDADCGGKKRTRKRDDVKVNVIQGNSGVFKKHLAEEFFKITGL